MNTYYENLKVQLSTTKIKCQRPTGPRASDKVFVTDGIIQNVIVSIVLLLSFGLKNMGLL